MLPEVFGDKKIEFSRLVVVLVEGGGDVLFFKKLTEHLGISQNVDIVDCGGKQRQVEFIQSNLPHIPGFKKVRSLLIIRDADDDCDEAYNQLCTALKMNHFSIPSQKGIIERIPENNRHRYVKKLDRIGIFIMPDNNLGGAIEDLCIQYLHDNKLMTGVNKYMDFINENEIKMTNSKSKAIIQTYIAPFESCCTVGTAADRGLLDFSNNIFIPLIDFIKQSIDGL